MDNKLILKATSPREFPDEGEVCRVVYATQGFHQEDTDAAAWEVQTGHD